MTIALVMVAAGAGAVVRHLVGQVWCSWQALLIVNTIGSGLLGAVVGASLSTEAATVAGVGLCGALTTFSSFALEAQRLGWRWGSAYSLVMVGCACGAASIGSSLV